MCTYHVFEMKKLEERHQSKFGVNLENGHSYRQISVRQSVLLGPTFKPEFVRSTWLVELHRKYGDHALFRCQSQAPRQDK